MADRYLAAMVKHDASGLPLAKGVRYTENTAEVQIGEGLWVGASEAPTTFKIYAVDLQAGEICKIRGGKIHEIEAMGVSLP